MHDESRSSPHRRTGRSYRRFYEGYTRYTVPKENGRGSRYVMVYTHNYYQPDVSPRRRALQKLFYILAALCTAVLLLVITSADTAYNRCRLAVIPQPFILASVLLFLFGAVYTALFDGKRTVYRHKVSVRYLLAGSIGSCVTFLAEMIFLMILLIRGTQVSEALPAVLGCAAAAGISAAVFLLEKNTVYLQVPSQEAAPPNAVSSTDIW